MVALKADSVKEFTSKLFIKDDFDRFLVRKAGIVTYNSFVIDGRIRRDFYTQEEIQEKEIGEYSSWGMLRPVCFSLIKGRKPPLRFEIDFLVPPEGLKAFAQEKGLMEGLLGGLCLKVRYENGALLCITGTALNTFTMDRTAEEEWDIKVKEFMRSHGLVLAEA